MSAKPTEDVGLADPNDARPSGRRRDQVRPSRRTERSSSGSADSMVVRDRILAVQERQASRTAVFVCQGRAVADGLIAPDLFTDPFAARVLLADERADVELGRLAAPPVAARQ